MSGGRPNWLRKHHRVLVNGKPRIVEDFYWTSTPVHNSDELIVKVRGLREHFNLSAVEPMPVRKGALPSHVKPGRPVYHLPTKELLFVHDTWLEDNAKTKKKTAHIRLESKDGAPLKDCGIDDVAPVPKRLHAAADAMIAARKAEEERLKAQSEAIEKMFRDLKSGRISLS
jgi:hypothetical protein